MERTLVILKPNAIQRELVGEIVSRFEKRGLKIVGLKMLTMTMRTAREHYAEHEGRSFFADLLEFITSGPSVLLVLEAVGAIGIVRSMSGDTDPARAAPGTIRGDYATTPGHNMIHASDSPSSAAREIALFFAPGELSEYSLAIRPWL